jgi:lysophospholipase L1-like esterase
MKPSPSRRRLFTKMCSANLSILDFIIKQDSNSLIRSNTDPGPATYIDVYVKMLNKVGEPIPEIFLDDSLHMNAKGYAIWKKEIEPYLQK